MRACSKSAARRPRETRASGLLARTRALPRELSVFSHPPVGPRHGVSHLQQLGLCCPWPIVPKREPDQAIGDIRPGTARADPPALSPFQLAGMDGSLDPGLGSRCRPRRPRTDASPSFSLSPPPSVFLWAAPTVFLVPPDLSTSRLRRACHSFFHILARLLLFLSAMLAFLV